MGRTRKKNHLLLKVMCGELCVLYARYTQGSTLWGYDEGDTTLIWDKETKEYNRYRILCVDKVRKGWVVRVKKLEPRLGDSASGTIELPGEF